MQSLVSTIESDVHSRKTQADVKQEELLKFEKQENKLYTNYVIAADDETGGEWYLENLKI